MKRILSFMGAALTLAGLLQPITNVPAAPVAKADYQISNVQEVKPTPTPTPQPVVVPPVPKDNETRIWENLVSNGYSREQTAGIMGNLQQEHNFNTSDVSGGLGIAQWINGRRDALMARGDYLNLDVQLQFLNDELNQSGVASTVKSQDVYGATEVFQNQFERCHPAYCYLSQRINYAINILGRH